MPARKSSLGADRLQPALNIEKALLPHDPLAPSAHDRVRSPSQIRADLARGIFRGPLKSVSPLATPHVGSWHLTDMSRPARDVRFEGRSGHAATTGGRINPTRLTHSG